MSRYVIAESNLDGAQPVVWSYDPVTRTHWVAFEHTRSESFTLAVTARKFFADRLGDAWTDHALSKGVY